MFPISPQFPFEAVRFRFYEFLLCYIRTNYTLTHGKCLPSGGFAVDQVHVLSEVRQNCMWVENPRRQPFFCGTFFETFYSTQESMSF